MSLSIHNYQPNYQQRVNNNQTFKSNHATGQFVKAASENTAGKIAPKVTILTAGLTALNALMKKFYTSKHFLTNEDRLDAAAAIYRDIPFDERFKPLCDFMMKNCLDFRHLAKYAIKTEKNLRTSENQPELLLEAARLYKECTGGRDLKKDIDIFALVEKSTYSNNNYWERLHSQVFSCNVLNPERMKAEQAGSAIKKSDYESNEALKQSEEYKVFRELYDIYKKDQYLLVKHGEVGDFFDSQNALKDSIARYYEVTGRHIYDDMMDSVGFHKKK